MTEFFPIDDVMTDIAVTTCEDGGTDCQYLLDHFWWQGAQGTQRRGTNGSYRFGSRNKTRLLRSLDEFTFSITIATAFKKNILFFARDFHTFSQVFSLPFA